MIKNTKSNKLRVGDIFSIELIDKTWSIVQLCYVFKVDSYLSLTFGLFNIRENCFEETEKKMDKYNISEPIFIATLDENPKKWKFIGNRTVEYSNINIEEGITGSWGWYKNTESSIYPKLEAYFGILPYDLYRESSHRELFGR